MTGVEDITGLRGENWMREMYHHLNNKYLLPLLLRENPETHDDDLMRTLNHLEIQQSIAEITTRHSSSKILKTGSRADKISGSLSFQLANVISPGQDLKEENELRKVVEDEKDAAAQMLPAEVTFSCDEGE